MDPSPLFDYMRARHEIYLKRKAGVPRGQWTDDPIFLTYRFCNVYRELDTTTIWLRENVREKIPPAHILLATVLFRWFNRIKTGEAIFIQEALGLGGEEPGETAWDCFLRTGDVDPIRAAIRQYCGKGPYVTGSYIIKTPDGMDKLDGVLWCVEQFYTKSFNSSGLLETVCREYDHGPKLNWQQATENLIIGRDYAEKNRPTLESVWEWLRKFPYLGDFMSYEIVTDLRHTPLLDKAPDIMTWANPGPGAMRGINRLKGHALKTRHHKSVYIEEMKKLLFVSEDRELWPKEYPVLEMRDIEHSLCELDKYMRVKTGEGAPRQKFR